MVGSREAILLQAIFPSLHPDVALDIAVTAQDLARAVRRAHRVVCPPSTLSVRVDRNDTWEHIKGVHQDYARATSQVGPQVTDVSHHNEYAETVVPLVVDTEGWHRSSAKSACTAALARYDQPSASNVALVAQHRSSEKRNRLTLLTAASGGAGVLPRWYPGDAVTSEVPLRGPLESPTRSPSQVLASPSQTTPTSALLVSRHVCEAKWKRATQPLEPFGDVFSPHDHRCSLRKELFLEGMVTFQRRWDEARAHILRGCGALAVDAVKVSPTPESGVMVTLPLYGAGVLKHSGIALKSIQLLASETRLEDVPGVAHKDGEHGPSPQSNPSNQRPYLAPKHDQGSSDLNHQSAEMRFRTIVSRIESIPVTLAFAPLSNPKDITEDTVRVVGKDLKIKLCGDVMLTPTGRVLLHVTAAKVRLKYLKIETGSTGKNVVLFFARPILRSMVEQEIVTALSGKHSL